MGVRLRSRWTSVQEGSIRAKEKFIPQQQVFRADDVAAAFGGPVTYLGTGSFGETWRVGDQAVKIIHRESSG